MRNLKRALSLALAFVMVMSLMIVGTSAKSYTDADKIDNQVAVEILGEIGVMVGNDDGSFAPDRDVTRAEMAVILTRILYGNNMNVDQFKNMNTFTDVPDWAEGFVNLCASLDIIAGRGNGIFDPDATVTSAEAALMLSRALGYFKNNAEFGNDWALAAMKRATQAGIIGGDMVLQANAGLDRDDVAQMTFNTLTKAVPVQYNEVLDVYYNENQGVIYALEFNYLQTLGYKNFSLVYKTNEQVEYGRPATVWGIGSYTVGGQTTASGIKKSDLTSEGGLLPTYVRMLDKDEIITVNNTPVYVYDNGTKEKDIYSDLGAAACNGVKDVEYDWTTFVNGEEVDSDVPAKNGSSNYQFTEKGAVTEIYVDDDTQDVTVVEINYYLGQVYSVDDGTTTIRALSDGGKDLDDRTFATEEFDEDEYVVFTVDYNDDDEFYICEMMAPETVTGEVARVENDDNSNDTYIRLDSKDGDKIYYTTDEHMVYDVNNLTADGQHPTLNEEYILYMTPAGYILGFEKANEKVPQYLYVQDSDEHLGSWDASVILPDATEPEVDVKDTFKQNGANVGIAWDDESLQHANTFTNIDFQIWDYSVNSSDVYSLTYIPWVNEVANIKTDLYQDRGGFWIQPDRAYVESIVDGNSFIVDEDTIFVDTINGVSYTGYSEVPTINASDVAYVVEDGVIQIMFILDGEVFDENMTFFFLTSTDRETEYDNDDDPYWEYQDSYVENQAQKIVVAYDALDRMQQPLNGDNKNYLEVGVLYCGTQSFEEDGTRYFTEVKEVAIVNPDKYGYYTGASTVDFVGGNAFGLNDANLSKFTTNNDTTYVLVERSPENPTAYQKALDNGMPYTGEFDWTVSKGRLSEMEPKLDFANDDVLVTVAKWNSDRVAELVYIYQITPNLVGNQYQVSVNCDLANAITATGTGAYTKGQDVTVNIKPNDGYQIMDVTVTSGTATVIDNGNGTFTVKADDIAANVAIEVTAITAQGNVYIIGDEITVTYQGEKPTVEEAIMAIEAKLAGLYTNERSITWSNVDNDYTFTVVTERGVSIEYYWDAHNDFIAGVNVEINGANVIVAKDADLTEAFAVANDAIEGYIVKDETTAVAAGAAVVADASYTDKNYKLETVAGNYYGQAEDKVAQEHLDTLTGKWVKLGNDGDNNDYYEIDKLTYGKLAAELGNGYDIVKPGLASLDGYYKLTVVDPAQANCGDYFTNDGTVNLNGKYTTKYALRDDGQVYSVYGGVNKVDDDETIYTGYAKLVNAKDATIDKEKMPTTALTWEGDHIVVNSDKEIYALGEFKAVFTIGNGFTAGKDWSIAVKSTVAEVSDSLKDVASVATLDSTKVELTENANIQNGTITFTGNSASAVKGDVDVQVTITANT